MDRYFIYITSFHIFQDLFFRALNVFKPLDSPNSTTVQDSAIFPSIQYFSQSFLWGDQLARATRLDGVCNSAFRAIQFILTTYMHRMRCAQLFKCNSELPCIQGNSQPHLPSFFPNLNCTFQMLHAKVIPTLFLFFTN